MTLTKAAPLNLYNRNDVFVPPVLAKWLRPHQREGVHFMYRCVMGLKDYKGKGCILADDMGLGKTLQSVTLIYTLLSSSKEATLSSSPSLSWCRQWRFPSSSSWTFMVVDVDGSKVVR